VEREDYAVVEQYLKAWVRGNVRRNNKSMRELCDGTGNTRVKHLLQKYEWVCIDQDWFCFLINVSKKISQ